MDPDRKSRERFVNPHIDSTKRNLKDFVLWLFGYFRDTPYERVPEGFSYPMPDLEFSSEKPWAMWIGHSTYLISVSGKHILTDPVWSKRVSPIPFMGPKRKHLPPLPILQLPQIDYVLISHDHYDHLDRKSVLELHERFPKILWVVPKGVKKWFTHQGIHHVVELDWWQNVDINSTFKVTAVPCQHFSGRQAPNRNDTLWAGFVVESLLHSKTFYFVGDTGYNEHDFKKIGQAFPQIDLSLIPIGAYSPRKFMAPVHVEPKDAVNIHLEVGSAFSLGMHWKTFCLSEEPMDQPPFDLLLSMRKKKLNPFDFLPIDPGNKINW